MIQRPSLASANGHLVERRAYVPGLVNPYPLADYLPGIYHVPDPFGRDPYLGQEPFVVRMTAALDLVLAPIFSCLDNFEAYLDPQLAPLDFLDWLGTWVGLVADENWPLERRRDFVSQASALYRIRGTPKGLATHVQIFTGGEVEILERGGTAYSTEPVAKLPGSPGFDIIVRVRVEDPSKVDMDRLNALVAAAKPAHLSHRVEAVSTKAPTPEPPAAVAPEPAPEAPPSGPPSEPSSDGEEPPAAQAA